MIRTCVAILAVTLAATAPQAQGQNYTNLLPDSSLSQWTRPNGAPVENGWKVEPGGVLHLSGGGGNILSREEYGDFDLWFEYRIATKGNNGIKYRVAQYNGSWLGIEYQIQDDAAFPKMAEKHKSASLYDIMDTSGPAFSRNYKPLDEFSVGRIVVQNNRARHWMNGNIVIDERLDGTRFDEAVRNSKFRDQQGFGRNPCGRLMLTDHNSEVWFRNVYVRRLDGCSPL